MNKVFKCDRVVKIDAKTFERMFCGKHAVVIYKSNPALYYCDEHIPDVPDNMLESLYEDE